jgi:hypothetical protein
MRSWQQHPFVILQAVCGINAMYPLAQFNVRWISPTSLFPIGFQIRWYREWEPGVQQGISGLPVSQCIYD